LCLASVLLGTNEAADRRTNSAGDSTSTEEHDSSRIQTLAVAGCTGMVRGASGIPAYWSCVCVCVCVCVCMAAGAVYARGVYSGSRENG